MEWMAAILDSVRSLECPCCGARLASGTVRGVNAAQNAVIVRLACGVCGENSVAIVKRDRHPERADPITADPITKDDVLDAHEFLERWHGQIAELFGAERKIA